MRVLLHDLSAAEFSQAFPAPPENTVILGGGRGHACIGCLGCWVKTPGQCVIRDAFGDLGALLGHAKEVILVSRLVYGGFSSQVKTLLDRCLPYFHPFFSLRNGETHYRMRYEKPLHFTVVFYGSDMTAAETATASGLVEANMVSFNAVLNSLSFTPSLREIGGLFS